VSGIADVSQHHLAIDEILGTPETEKPDLHVEESDN
jgi:hypothetical protein